MCSILLEQCQCSSPGTIQNGFQQPSTITNICGAIIRFTCNFGYEIVGDSTLTCVSNNRWSGSIPRCVQPCVCSNPPRLFNGFFSPEGSVRCNSFVTYQCNQGYTLQGASRLQCINRVWSGPAPFCQRQGAHRMEQNFFYYILHSFWKSHWKKKFWSIRKDARHCVDHYSLATIFSILIFRKKTKQRNTSWALYCPCCEARRIVNNNVIGLR